ncbi:hypothetical protein E2C01_031255 [Portunus trituberculatus]|uniref:Uncharacterized protein n=1 Tax=Portunus trituberculatus TaxID=210409 RepID=A0A5B7EWD9_PORTR|nr:hypothetical protein [Portunus trituberculatus]
MWRRKRSVVGKEFNYGRLWLEGSISSKAAVDTTEHRCTLLSTKAGETVNGKLFVLRVHVFVTRRLALLPELGKLIARASGRLGSLPPIPYTELTVT